VQLDEGELGGAVDRDEQVELALLGADLGDVDMEVADGVGLELAPVRLVAFDSGKLWDTMSLEAAMQLRARQARDAGMEGVEAITASSSIDNTVDFAILDRSADRRSRCAPSTWRWSSG